MKCSRVQLRFQFKRDGKLRQAVCPQVMRALDGAGQKHRATIAARRWPAQRASPLRSMKSQDVASATNGPGGRDERLRLFTEGHRFGRASGAGFAKMIAIIGPAVCGLLAQGTT